jgi:hypothetical protein
MFINRRREKRIKDAEEKRKAELARAKKLREIGGAISRGPQNLGELTERGLGAVVTGFGNQIKSDEATRDAQYAEEKARAAASAYAKNPTDSNRSKYQTAKGRFEKATDRKFHYCIIRSNSCAYEKRPRKSGA